MCSYVNKFTAPSLIASALLAMSCMGASAAVPSTTNTASSATVNVQASVLPATCTASWNGGDTMINLGSVAINSMGTAAGDVGLTKNFKLSLTHCDPGVTKVKVTTEGTPDPDNPEAYKNSVGSGTPANGVAVQLLAGTKTLGNGDSEEFTAAANTIDLPLTARLINTKGAGVTAGKVNSTITLNIDYE